MKIIISIATAIILVSCATQKTTETPVRQGDTASTTNNTSGLPASPDKIGHDSIPACIKKLIAGFSAAPVGNPPRKIVSYTYRDRTVYYVQPECCDNFSELYDANCTLLGHPDGGFTGRGDGSFPDFNKERTNEKLVWQDNRK